MDFYGTIGPACADVKLLQQMVEAGMTGIRMNLSHGPLAAHKDWLALLRKAGVKKLLIDLQGPELRIGRLPQPLSLTAGQTVRLGAQGIPCPAALVQGVQPGQELLLDDGKLLARVDTAEPEALVCTVVRGGVLQSRKSLAAPGADIQMPTLTTEDKENLAIAAGCGVTGVMLPFVRGAADIRNLRQALAEAGAPGLKILAKIENLAGVQALPEFLPLVDEVVIARGDLGNAMPLWELPRCQKQLSAACRAAGVPFMVVTQMLDSMIVNPRPTRAEISDVANAIYDGTSAIMLSGETAAGAYPVEALKTMSAIAERTEQEGFHLRGRMMDSNPGKISVSDATAHAACLTARDVNAAAIVTVSESGTTARLLSKYRPQQPIIACVMREQVQRQLSLSWGITPLMMSLAHSTDELIEMSTALAKENGYLHNGELAVVTAGVPVGVSGTTNMIKIHMVGNCLATGVGVGRGKTDLVSASGKACVCRTMDEVRAKFKPGMVLVVPSTSNEMLSFVRDAAALVVEEPGLNSHAAIAGKALLKPTVVGAAGATSHIRDGLMVAVDCAHGSVQRLQG